MRRGCADTAGWKAERNGMTDRELLERAAKAAGIKLNWHVGCDGSDLQSPTQVIGGAYYFWNPIHDDGEALRLLVALREELALDAAEMIGMGQFKKWKEDPMAITRRAIVRAAAEVGKRYS
jgi:hypothetical protein